MAETTTPGMTATLGASPIFRFRAMRWRDALAAARWRYPGEYAIYDLGLMPLLFSALFHSTLRLAGVYSLVISTETDPFVGVFSLIQRDKDVELGIGIRPDLMGHHLGVAIMEQGMDYARRRLRHVETFSLDVATFNKRAITVYTRAGFQPGPLHPFYFGRTRYESMRMSRPA